MRISDWSSDVCSSDLRREALLRIGIHGLPPAQGARSAHQSGLCRDKGRRSVPHQDYPPERDVADRLHLLQDHRVGLDVPLDRARRLLALYHRSAEHTSELQSLLRISYADICLKTNNN